MLIILFFRTNSFRFALAKQQFPNILLTHGCYNIQNRLWMVNEMTEMSLERAMREGMTIDRDDVAMQIACGFVLLKRKSDDCLLITNLLQLLFFF